jgi:alpha-beta hydrolase superfamily lysophospholipase
MNQATAITHRSREVSLEHINGKKIFVVRDIARESKKVVLMCHGFRGTSVGPARQFVDFAMLLNQHGISAVRFDQPCSGNSEGDYLDSSFHEWVKTTIVLASHYIQQGYQLALMGQSMGATTSVVSSAHKELKGKVSALLLWVPDPKSSTSVEGDEIYEEGGQKYRGTFWNEARESDFFACLEESSCPVHLVYGENDRYISAKLREQVVKKVKEKRGEVHILPTEDHSPWTYENAHRVMKEELQLLKKVFVE